MHECEYVRMGTLECQPQCAVQCYKDLQQAWDVDLRAKRTLHYVFFLHHFLSSSSAVLSLVCKVSTLYTHAKQRQLSKLGRPFIFDGPKWTPDYMSCQIEDSSRKVASNISQGTKQRVDCGNQGY